MNLDDSLPDLNEIRDINDSLTPVVPSPESPHPIHLEQQDPPPTNQPPMLSVPLQSSATNKSSHHLTITKPNYGPNLRTRHIRA